MKLTAILDWYLLERLNAEIVMNPPSDEDVKGHVIASQIRSAFNDLTESLSLAFRDYVFMISFGEARHAWNLCEGEVPSDLPRCSYRSECFDTALSYAPNEHNINALFKVFDDNYWKAGSYGGKSWARIVKALRLFDKNRAIFIDHVVDLHHNGGGLFDKDDAFNILDFELDSYFSDYSLKSFLDCKANQDILRCSPYYFQWISRKTRRLVWEYFSHFVRGRIPYISPRDTTVDVPEWYDYNPAEWGDDELSDDWESVNAFTCDNCGDLLNEWDSYYEVGGEYYCSDCYHDIFTDCDACGDPVSKDDINEVPGHYLCDWCYKNRTETCAGCGGTFYDDDTRTVEIAGESKEVCEDCYYSMGECEECGGVVFDDKHCDHCFIVKNGYYPEQMVLPGLDAYINNEVTS